jgi:acetyltransferase-like isoleucine patch superfamily enzyme
LIAAAAVDRGGDAPYPPIVRHDGLAPADLLDLSKSLAGPLLGSLEFAWLLMPLLAQLIEDLVAEPPPGYVRIADGIIAGEGARISPRAELGGPAVIGPGSELRTGAFIRENVLVGRGCVVGNSSELKNCVLFDSAQAPHFNYVGDSILGQGAHIGAGAVLSNLKSDRSLIVVSGPGGGRFATGLLKFGAILGDGAEIGCNAVCFPGAIVGRESVAYPLSSVRGFVPARHILKNDGSLVPRSDRRLNVGGV